MIHNLKPYPAYKDSGVDWLGEVPTHWEVRRLRYLIEGKLTYGANAAAEYTDPTWPRYLRITDFSKNGRLRTDTFRSLPPEIAKDYLVKPGDVLLARSGATVGKAFLVDEEAGTACHAGYLIRARLNRSLFCPAFFFAFTQSASFARWKDETFIIATIQNIGADKYADLPVPLPPLSEQTAIVRFLDHADRRIRRYIRAKQKLSALLEEQKQAIIHQAVTGQIDVRTGQPYPAYKSSGVEWLGDVPAHWDMMRARFLFKEIDIRSTTGEETHLSMSQTLGLVPSHMVERTLTSDSYIGGKLCEEGDLVLNRLKAHLGVFALAKQAGVISPDYSVFRKRGAEDMEYYERVCRLPALRTELRIRAKGIVEGFWRLYTEDLFDIRLPVPSFLEQRAIAEYVTKITLSIDDAISRSQREIELLREYRTRLIADVVTGKLDVREAAAALPEVDLLVAEDTLGDALNPDAPTGPVPRGAGGVAH